MEKSLEGGVFLDKQRTSLYKVLLTTLVLPPHAAFNRTCQVRNIISGLIPQKLRMPVHPVQTASRCESYSEQ